MVAGEIRITIRKDSPTYTKLEQIRQAAGFTNPTDAVAMMMFLFGNQALAQAQGILPQPQNQNSEKYMGGEINENEPDEDPEPYTETEEPEEFEGF